MNADLTSTLEKFQQTHLLAHWDDLDEAGRKKLADQLADVDFETIQTLVAGKDEKADFAGMAARAGSPPSAKMNGDGESWTLAQAVEAGEKALRNGEVAAVIVAGGQGTRLGFDKPKGMYPIGPVSNRTLFQFFADMLVAVGKRYGVKIPFYVMVSEATEIETREYFESNHYLGLDRDAVIIFKQGTMPAVDADTGKVLLSDKDSLALSPDGHGGTVRALDRGGCFADCDQRGIKHLFYIQVDNPLANLCHPALIGHHILSGSEMTTQVVRKRYPKERVGNVVLVDGKVQIIEYSDLPDEAAEATDSEGELQLWAGNIAVHVFSIEFLKRMNQSVDALPFHRASKKVPHLKANGQMITPDSPNATKFERFIFDLLPQAANALVVESSPKESFAPVKNAEGAETDTAYLAQLAISDLHRYWLEGAGAKVTGDVKVEINPKFCLDQAEVRQKIEVGTAVDRNRYFNG